MNKNGHYRHLANDEEGVVVGGVVVRDEGEQPSHYLQCCGSLNDGRGSVATVPPTRGIAAAPCTHYMIQCDPILLQLTYLEFFNL